MFALTVGVDGRHVGPVKLPHHVDHHLGLVVVGWDDTHEGAIACLIGQIFRCGRIADLWNRKELKQILNLMGWTPVGNSVGLCLL